MTSEKRKRDEKHQRIRTALAVARFVLWVLWMLIDPRHRF